MRSPAPVHLLLSVLCLSWTAASHAASPSTNRYTATRSTTQAYTSLLREQIKDCSRPQLPVISRGAESAADRILGGGTLWVTGSQKEFPAEAVQRAGGLMLI